MRVYVCVCVHVQDQYILAQARKLTDTKIKELVRENVEFEENWHSKVRKLCDAAQGHTFPVCEVCNKIMRCLWCFALSCGVKRRKLSVLWVLQ